MPAGDFADEVATVAGKLAAGPTVALGAMRRAVSYAAGTTFAAALDMICTPDVLIHTWDLARATGLHEELDPEEVRRMLTGIEPMDAALRASGHYGPRVEVAAGADEQTRLLAFLGRRT